MRDAADSGGVHEEVEQKALHRLYGRGERGRGHYLRGMYDLQERPGRDFELGDDSVGYGDLSALFSRNRSEVGLEVSARILEGLACDPPSEGVKAFIGPAGYFREFEREVVSVPDVEQEQEF